jgi:hypothetical protein
MIKRVLQAKQLEFAAVFFDGFSQFRNPPNWPGVMPKSYGQPRNMVFLKIADRA